MCTIPIRAPSTSTTRSSGSVCFSAALVHVPVHGLDRAAPGRATPEKRRRDEVARVQDQIGRATQLDAALGSRARPTRQVRVGDDGDGRRAVTSSVSGFLIFFVFSVTARFALSEDVILTL